MRDMNHELCRNFLSMYTYVGENSYETTHHKEEDLVAAFNRACYKHNEGYITMHPYIYKVCRDFVIRMNNQMGGVFYINRAIDYAN